MSNSTLALYPLYVEALRAIRENRAEYERECEEYRAQGFRPQYCIHGVNMWVDYDCACWRCEEGEQPDTIQAYNMVTGELRRAKRQSFMDSFAHMSAEEFQEADARGDFEL